MALWIRDGAAAHDAAQALKPVLALADSAPPAYALSGLGALLLKAKVSNHAAATALERELLDQGANAVDEVLPADWLDLRSWSCLRPFEQRRFLAAL